ncbi:MAG: glycine--tRNA ligase subunit alpha [Candidatus Hodgkinia cicadicola]
MLNLEKCISALDRFWTSLGCLKLNPNINRLGAATFHPEMLKQVVASKHCKLCYFQPTFRPYDGDYGLSCSLQQHVQYQVIIKPFYGAIGKLYLESLKCLGYSSLLHKLVLNKSSWESSSLCAWGEGWECVLNSIEVSQITLFRQICGVKCTKPVIEIAYGLERLEIALCPSRLAVSACELGFNYYNLNCVSVFEHFQTFSALESELKRAARFQFFGVYYPVCDAFLRAVCVYNQLVAKSKLKRKVLRMLLLKLQRLVCVVARASTQQNVN